MGMYTELFISTKLKNDPQCINVLQHMLGTKEITQFPDHDLFKTDRWQYMLRCSSYYFVPRNMSLLEYDDIGGYWCFICRSDFKNYGDEITKFIDWLKPYLDDTDDMIGYYRYEEDREPTIIYP